MVQTVRDVMTEAPVVLDADSPVTEAARLMKVNDIGDVLVSRNGQLCGVVTDRDIVVRVLAESRDAGKTTLDEICSHELVAVAPTDPVDEAIALMREHAVRRIPVVNAGQPTGVVSIGDLALELDPRSALADVSAAPPNR